MLEYGSDILELDITALNSDSKVVIIDDLIATGGTAIAAGNLIKKLGANIHEYSFLVNLPDLGGEKKLQNYDYSVHFLIEYDGE